MIQYDWDRVKAQAAGSSRNIILIMSAITWPQTLPTRDLKRINPYYWKDFSGLCFLANPERLLTKKYDYPVRDIVEYIALASRRSLADYLLTGNKKLDLRLAPFVPSNNQLLTITNNEVQFKYE